MTMKRVTPLAVVAAALAMLPAVASAQVPAVDAESEAEAALKALGANISRNDDGEVWSVVLDYGRQVSGFGDTDVVHLTKLNWAEGVPGDHDFPEIFGVVPSHPAPFLILSTSPRILQANSAPKA